MDLWKLRVFVAVAEELHFSRAAKRLFASPATVSESIRGLERELGLELFVRTSRRVELTEAGAGLLPYARRVLRDVEVLLERASGEPGADRAEPLQGETGGDAVTARESERWRARPRCVGSGRRLSA